MLKVANSGWPPGALTAQDDILRLLAGRLPDLAVPVPVADPTSVTIDGEAHAVRLLTYVEGEPLSSWDHLAAPVVAQLGAVAAVMSQQLRGVEHPGLERWLQWDLRRAHEVVAALVPRVEDPALRGRVEAATAEAWQLVSAVADQLPLQAVHGDLTDDNLVADAVPTAVRSSQGSSTSATSPMAGGWPSSSSARSPCSTTRVPVRRRCSPPYGRSTTASR